MADPPIPYLPIEPGILQNRVVLALRRADPQIGAWIFLHVLLAMGNQDGSRWMHGLLEFDTRDLADDLTRFLDADPPVSTGAIISVLEVWKKAKSPNRFMVEYDGKNGVKIYWPGFRERANHAAANRIRMRYLIKIDEARAKLVEMFDFEIANFSSKLHKKVSRRLQTKKRKEKKSNNPPYPPPGPDGNSAKRVDKSTPSRKGKKGTTERPETGLDRRTGEPVKLGDVLTGKVKLENEGTRDD